MQNPAQPVDLVQWPVRTSSPVPLSRKLTFQFTGWVVRWWTQNLDPAQVAAWVASQTTAIQKIKKDPTEFL